MNFKKNCYMLLPRKKWIYPNENPCYVFCYVLLRGSKIPISLGISLYKFKVLPLKPTCKSMQRIVLYTFAQPAGSDDGTWTTSI